MNRLDAGWTDYVLSQMTPDEKVFQDDKEFPRIAGLRRVARLLMGPIRSGKNGDPVPIRNGVSVTHTLTCYLKDSVRKSEELPYETEEWSGSADCTDDNGGGARDYATAFADTRAEARALVRLLQLNRCSAEEFGSKPQKKNSVEVSVPSGPDTKMHDILCQRLNIDKEKFYNVCGRHKDMFGSKWNPSNMTRDEAIKLGDLLNEFQQGKQEIPKSIVDSPF